MSAIFGIYTSDLSTPSLAEMQRIQMHLGSRGPDASGIWIEPGAALGICLLRTTPESLYERLPARDVEGICCITADARLDNRKELMAELRLWHDSAAEIPDSTLILEAYQKWGEDCPQHLLGDFAFAIWNSKTKTLFCARDHFGVKPFNYCQVGSHVAFCSHVDGLLKLDWIPRRLNERHLASHLTTFFGDTTATFFLDIVRLPPAHSLRVNAQGIRVTKYWSLNPECETVFKSDEEYVEAFRAVFQEAVKTRLRSFGKVGSMLSGGLDSSSISAVAGDLLGKERRGPLATFSAVFDEVPRSNERGYIAMAVQRGGFEPSYLAADQCDPFRTPPELEGTQAEVHVAANLFLNWGLYGMARERGVRVILDGFDGDSTISHGVTHLRELANANRWLELSRLAPAASRACGCSALGLWWAYVWHQGLSLKLPPLALRLGNGVARRWNRLRQLAGRHSGDNPVLDEEFVQRIGLREYRASLRATARPPARTEKEAHYQTLMWGVMPATLEMLAQTAAPFGIELRYPFWDRRVIEFCLGLPAQFKIREGHTRWILRKAMEGLLPREVQWRARKSNIGHAFKHCLYKHGLPALEQAVAKAPKQLRPYVNARRLEATRGRALADAGDGETLFQWQMANLTLWLEKTRSQA